MTTVDVQPAERLTETNSRMEDVKRQSEMAPCGNFSAAYQCMCDYYGIDFMEDVAWVGPAYFCRYSVMVVIYGRLGCEAF